MKITAIGFNLVLKLQAREEVSEGGIAIPEQARDKPQDGVILSKGSLVTLPVEEGDTVGVSKFGGTVAVIGGVEVLFVHEEKLLYVHERPEAA